MIHNPENVESPGEGYRFLTAEEIDRRRCKNGSEHIEMFICGRWIPGSHGKHPLSVYRTKLTPEELEAER